MPFRYGTCICIRAFLRRRANCAPGTHRGAEAAFSSGRGAQNRRIQPLRFQERGSLRKSWGKQGAAEILKEHGRKDCTAQHAYFLLCPPLPWRGHVICCRYGLARPPGFREEPKRAPESGFPDWIQGGARSEKQCGPLGHARNGDRLWRIRLYSL